MKNEYRKELVLFSIFFGMGVKSILISISLAIIGVIACAGFVLLLIFWAAPYLIYKLISL